MKGKIAVGRKIKKVIFDELIIGLGGKDVIESLDGLSDMQKGISKKLSEGRNTSIKKVQEELENYPKRCRIIYKGFCNGWSLEELNENLLQKDEERLYARDLIEATLIYAFRKRISFAEWKELVLELKETEKDGLYDDLLINGFKGSYSAFPLSRVENYVKMASVSTAGSEYTIQKTKMVEKNLEDLNRNREFVSYICENIRDFCEGREKARYYVCKYFLLYLNTQIDFYMLEGISRTNKRNIYLELPLSNISKMDPNRHANMTIEEVSACLAEAKVSSNKLFEIVNRFYFYILLAESDAEDPGWEEYSLMAKILRGDTISRSFLLLLLLFFGSDAQIADEGLKLNVQRINDIPQSVKLILGESP